MDKPLKSDNHETELEAKWINEDLFGRQQCYLNSQPHMYWFHKLLKIWI